MGKLESNDVLIKKRDIYLLTGFGLLATIIVMIVNHYVHNDITTVLGGFSAGFFCMNYLIWLCSFSKRGNDNE